MSYNSLNNNMMNKLLSKFIGLLSLMAIFMAAGCNKTSESGEAGEAHEEAAAGPEADVRFLELTAEQFKAAEIEYKPIEEKNLSDILTVTGILDVPPQNLISINAPYGGFLKKTDLLEGSRVKKGQVIATLEHPDYIQVQQDYLDNSSKLEYLEKERERQRELAKENVTATKVQQKAESEYKSMLAMVKGLEAKLALMGVSKARVLEGNFTSSIVITSPIDGYVTRVNANIGKYVNPEDIIFEIVDTEHLHVELTVFEKDISKIREGQKIRFTLANEPGEERTATVHLIGRAFDESRAVHIHGHLDQEDPHLLPGMFINAVIELGNNKVTAVPKDAILISEGKEFIFVRNRDCAEHPECSAHETCPREENCKEHPQCEEHEKCPKEENCKEHPQCEAHEHEKHTDTVAPSDSTGKANAKEAEEEYYTFTKINVKSGISDGVYTEVKFLETMPPGSQVVTKGAFFLLSKAKMGGVMDACGQ